MKKVLEMLKENKRVLLIGLGVVVIIIGALLIPRLFATDETAKQKESLETTLKEMGKDFYENYYNDYLKEDEREEALSKFSDTGIKINLDNLSRYNSKVNEEKVKEFVNNETGEECDKEKTQVIIYPKAKYGKSDYELKVELVCGFKEKEEK